VAQTAEAMARREAAARDSATQAATAARTDTSAAAAPDTARAQPVPAQPAAQTDAARAVAPAPQAHPAAPSPSGEGRAPIPADSGRALETLTPEAGAGTARASGGFPAWDRFRIDPVGNGASVVVLAAMVAALVLVGLALAGRGVRIPVAPGWVVPVIGVIGLCVAAYLSFVEVTGTRAVCGPVGDCNTVNQSEYARLFGVLPIGVLGMVGYVWMVGLWLVGGVGPGDAARAGRLGAWGSALLGTGFSVYLTFLEPFVIGATCAWCLSSAVMVTLMMLVMTPAARRDVAAWREARRPEPGAPRGIGRPPAAPAGPPMASTPPTPSRPGPGSA